ncbi:hypothetical protein Tco_0412144 [Tanacetum coccineum]
MSSSGISDNTRLMTNYPIPEDIRAVNLLNIAPISLKLLKPILIQMKEVILRMMMVILKDIENLSKEKLFNVPRLISNIESLKVNSTPDRVLESPSPFPIPVADSDSFLEESDTSLSHLDNSLPECEF